MVRILLYVLEYPILSKKIFFKMDFVKLMNSVCHGGGKSPYVSLFLAKWHPTLSIFFFPLLFLNPLILGTPPEQIFWEILFISSSSSRSTTNNHEDYEGPFRPLLSVSLSLSLPLRHFRSFSLIRAPFWPAGGSMPSYVPCINIGQKTYLKKKWVRMKLVGTSHIHC